MMDKSLRIKNGVLKPNNLWEELAMSKKLVGLIFAFLLVGCQSEKESNPFTPSLKLMFYSVTQNKEGIKREMDKKQDSFRSLIKLPDPHRRIDRNQAPLIAGQSMGVSSAKWLDASTILITPSSSFNNQTVEGVCQNLEKAGDSLAVIVAYEISNQGQRGLKWKNCKLPEGIRAFGSLEPKLK